MPRPSMHETARIVIPARPDVSYVLAVAQSIQGYSRVEVDFSQLAFLTPATALLLSSTLRRYKIEATVNAHAPAFGYSAHVGFFDACGISVGQAVGAASGNDNYTPLKRVECNDIKLAARRMRIPIPELLESRAENLARVLTQNQEQAVRRFVGFAVREIFRNCVEHSRSFDFWYAGQYWPNSNIVEVAILDEGIGILESLGSNLENAKPITELESIKLALRPGVTGVPKTKRRGNYANSGYGLYMARRLCAVGSGSFGIVSNGSGILISETDEAELAGASVGTLLQLRMDAEWLDSLETSFIEHLAIEGEREARELMGMVRPASSGSRSIRLRK